MSMVLCLLVTVPKACFVRNAFVPHKQIEKGWSAFVLDTSFETLLTKSLRENDNERTHFPIQCKSLLELSLART